MNSRLIFDDEYPIFYTAWYPSGQKKAEGRYKEYQPREGWSFWSEDGDSFMDNESSDDEEWDDDDDDEEWDDDDEGYYSGDHIAA
jgi:hypothetical protein